MDREGCRVPYRPMGHLIGYASAATIVLLAGCSPFKSEVPIVTIDTRGRALFDEPKVAAEMVIHLDPSQSTQTLGSPADFRGEIGVELIGHSSLLFKKKSYALEIRDGSGQRSAAPLLGLPSESDWVLHGPYTDKSLMRNYLAYALASRLHLASPRTHFVELFIRQQAWGLAYQGVYLLVTASGRSPEALGIATLEPSDTTGPKLSGGYVVQVDRVSRADQFFTLPADPMSLHRDTIIFVVPRHPAAAQRAWLASYFDSMETVLPPATSASDPRRYSRFIDVDSFADYLLLQEMLKNIDGYRFSSSIHKDRGGPLRMGPVWDFDLSSGNASYDDGCDTDGWLIHYFTARRTAKAPPRWWRRLLKDPAFADHLRSRWRDLRSGPLATDSVLAIVDRAAVTLRHAQKRNFDRWPTLGHRIWPNCPIPGSNPRAYYKSWDDEVGHLRSWLRDRLAWMDDHVSSIAAE